MLNFLFKEFDEVFKGCNKELKLFKRCSGQGKNVNDLIGFSCITPYYKKVVIKKGYEGYLKVMLEHNENNAYDVVLELYQKRFSSKEVPNTKLDMSQVNNSIFNDGVLYFKKNYENVFFISYSLKGKYTIKDLLDNSLKKTIINGFLNNVKNAISGYGILKEKWKNQI